MPVMDEERHAIVDQVERLDETNTPARSYRSFFDAFLRRPGFHRSRAITCGTTAPVGADRTAWTLQEDMGLLAGSDQRDDAADSRRNTYLNNLLTPHHHAIEQPELEPELEPEPEQVEHPTAPVAEPADPAAVIGLGSEVKAVIYDNLNEVFIELAGHGGVTYTKEQVATAISRLVLVHDMMEDK